MAPTATTNRKIRSLTVSSLRTKKKGELQELAVQLGLDSTGLRGDLERRIREHIEAYQSSDFSEENETVQRPERNLSLPAPDDINSDSASGQSERSSESSGGDEKSRKIETKSAAQDVETVIASSSRSTDSTLASPSSSSTLSILGSVINAIGIKALNNWIKHNRPNFTNTTLLLQTSIMLQLFVFFYNAVDWIKYTSVPIGARSTERTDYVLNLRGPDLLVLFEWHRFWRPLICYLLYVVLLPLGFSYVFNKEPQRHEYSPIAFALAHYSIQAMSASHFDWVEDVREFVPENLISTSAGSAVVFALYESMIQGKQ